jgi:hypothetical protein
MAHEAALAGSLRFISLADIFQILGGNSSTGILRITNRHSPDPGLIYFRNGDPIDATSGSMSGVDAVYALFGWEEGKFAFHEEEVQSGRAIKKSMMEIVLDAMRMLDDGLIKRVGSPSLDEAASAKVGVAGFEKKGTPRVITGPLVDYSYVLNEEEYRDGEIIVKEGGHGKWIWTILKGSIAASRETPKGPMTIARLGKGSFIGSFGALKFREYTRSASVTAMGDVQLGLMDTELLHREFTSLSPDFRGLLLSLDGRLRKITDTAVALFGKEGSTKGLPKDRKLIIKKGSTKNEAFSILQGEAYVIGQAGKDYVPLLTLEKDEVFGYMPFMEIGHEPGSALILASNDLEAKRLDTERLQKEYEQLPGTTRNMMYNICTCIFVTTKLAYHLYGGK